MDYCCAGGGRLGVDVGHWGGVVTFTPTAANTAIIGAYFYDVQLTDADGNVRTVVKNTFTITQDITK